MICKSFFAAAAIRSCSGAFVTNSPRSSRLGAATGVSRSSLWNKKYCGSTRRQNHSILTNNARNNNGLSSLRVTLSPSFSSMADSDFANTTPLQPLVVCGPSGVGKGTIIGRFMDANHNNHLSGIPKFGFSVSHTTRQPRPGEVDGVHYHFVTREFMEDKIEAGSFFIEYAEVHGNMYGTSFQSILDVSSNVVDSDGIEQQCLLDIDVEGVRSIKDFQCKQKQAKKNEPTLGKERSTQQYTSSDKSSSDSLPTLDAKFIFIAPPSVDVLRERLTGRGTETPETLERRFQNAKAELEYGMEPGNFDAIVVNDDLDQACVEFENVVKGLYC